VVTVAADYCRSSTGVIDVAKRHVGGGLERRIAAQEDRIADAKASVESSATGSENGLIVPLIRDAETRLDLVPADFREIVGVTAAAMQVIESAGGGFGEAALARNPGSCCRGLPSRCSDRRFQ